MIVENELLNNLSKNCKKCTINKKRKELSIIEWQNNLDLPEQIIDYGFSIISINYSNLEYIPHELLNCNSVINLDLSHNALSVITKDISKLSNLQQINLSFNKFEEFPLELSKITSLKEIKFDYNNLKFIPQTIFQGTNFEKMSFFNNKIENFIINSQNCILKVLEISNNNLYEIPRDFYNLNELISLSIEGNYINLIPEKINNLKNLVTLMISCNPIQQIDTDFSQLTKLKYLIIDYYHFEKIKNFDKLKQKVEIKDLSMKNDLQIQLNYNYREIFEYDQNCLKDIIAKFGLIPLIEVDDDKYNSIDVGIGVKDHHIISIRLPHKNLKEFPLSICNIVTLKELILDENFIEKIPIKINYLNQLEIFSISRNLLTSLPKINQWSNLKKLILDNNKLIEIPISISELKQIEEINIAGNLIQELPDIFYNFSLLKILLIEDNPLKSVPDSIGFCRKLKILNFGSAMHHLSPWLISLTELEEFTFGGSFQNEPLEILKYVFHNNLDEAYFNKKKDIKNFQKRLQNILDGTAP